MESQEETNIVKNITPHASLTITVLWPAAVTAAAAAFRQFVMSRVPDKWPGPIEWTVPKSEQVWTLKFLGIQSRQASKQVTHREKWDRSEWHFIHLWQLFASSNVFSFLEQRFFLLVFWVIKSIPQATKWVSNRMSYNTRTESRHTKQHTTKQTFVRFDTISGPMAHLKISDQQFLSLEKKA